MQRTFSKEEWLGIHNREAGAYKSSEFFRETILGARKLRQALFQQATGEVLDVACGYGNSFPYLTHARHITGVDFSPVMLEIGREVSRRLGLKADLRQGDAEALDFPDGSFDTVVSALATCSFLDPVEALREMGRVCKPDGRILLLEHGRSSWEWLGRYQDRTAPRMLEQGDRWNQEPQQLVQEAGLKILSARRTMLGIVHSLVVSPR